MSASPKNREAASNEIAAGWVVRMASDQRTRGDEEAFAEWLAGSPDHADEYGDHAELWEGLGALADDPEARSILGMNRPETAVLRPRFGRRRFMITAALAAAASAAYLAFPIVPGMFGSSPKGEVFETALGEQRRLMLADGTQVTLNTGSRLRVQLAGTERRLFLERGQAYFKVARDAFRPFRVFVGNDEVRALGTAFEVWRMGDKARVTLEEGRVALYRNAATNLVPIEVLERKKPQSARRASPEQPALVLAPGQQTEITNAEIEPPVPVDLASSQAWRFGRMVLDRVPLGEVVADINRYGGRQIVLADPKLLSLPISGVFHTNRPEVLVDGVTTALPVRLRAQDSEKLVLSAE